MCSGIIMLLEDSKNDIIKRLKSLKRLSSIPERLMITASSGGTSSDEIIDDSLTMNSKASSKNTQEKNSDLEKILTAKLYKLTQSTMKDVDENQSQFISPNKEREHINVRRKADRAKLSGSDCWECEKYYKNLSLSKDELQKRKNKCSRHRRKYERPITPEGFWNPEFPDTQSSERVGKCIEPVLEKGCSNSKITNEEHDPLQTSTCETTTDVVNDVDNHDVDNDDIDNHLSELKEKVSLLREQKSKLQSRIKELHEYNNNLEGERKEMKKKLEKVTSELTNVRKLNERLQTALIDKTNECETTLKTVLTSNINMQYENNFPPIGTRQSTSGMIHIGRNEWMSEIHYNRVLNSSKTPRQFASNIILANFDDELLMTSTVTGYTTAQRGKKKKCNKLDEKKLRACEDAYKHCINNVYKTKFADTPDKDNSMREMSKFYYYVGKNLLI
ncbi:uncharacterized protein LOC113005939 [Solenopsis invicta]|uniref:uncharacterized protein LOC113005939 n=1 Tax=Solenopsis invicta TaxID=13686 RepID=UPI00193DC0C0|nr:uncharacterized protein LOC113005939 [Solenopsis invicta]